MAMNTRLFFWVQEHWPSKCDLWLAGWVAELMIVALCIVSDNYLNSSDRSSWMPV